MTILFDATRPVKTTRRFGAGLLRSLPTYRTTVSAADEAWLIADNARRDAANRKLDRRASEAEAHARYENGWL
jgi:hypothetical protein